MPHVDSHTPATINWVDFVSTDLEAATGFYTGLFGWETEDMPMPGGEGIYRFFRLGGRDAAARITKASRCFCRSPRCDKVDRPGSSRPFQARS